MTVLYVGSGAYAESNVSNANVTYPYPTGYTPINGDISVIVQYGLSNSLSAYPNSPNAGGTYTDLGTGQYFLYTTYLVIIVRYRVLDGTEATVTVNTSSNLSSGNAGNPAGFCGGFINIYRQIDTLAPTPEAPVPPARNGTTNTSTAATTFTPSSITTTLPDTLVLSVVATNQKSTLALSTANGFTLRKSSNGVLVSAGAIALADVTKTTPGANTMPIWSGSSTAWVSYTLDLAQTLGGFCVPGIVNMM